MDLQADGIPRPSGISPYRSEGIDPWRGFRVTAVILAKVDLMDHSAISFEEQSVLFSVSSANRVVNRT